MNHRRICKLSAYLVLAALFPACGDGALDDSTTPEAISEERSALMGPPSQVLFDLPQLWSGFFCQSGEVCKAADVNGDGKTDVIAFNHGLNGANAVWVGLSTGTGFAAAQQWSSFFCVSGETCLVADVNGDGKADIVAATGSPNNQVFVSLSNGTSFGAPQQSSSVSCQIGEVCKLADVNGDGKADIIAFNHGLNGANAVHVGLSYGTIFGGPQLWSSYFCLSSETCEVGDVDGNGKADILAFTRNPNDQAFVGLSSGTSFGAPQLWSSFFCQTGEVCRAADFNGDHMADVVAFNHGLNGANAAWVAASNGASFTPAYLASGYFCTGSESCEVGDVNGDGRADLIAFTPATTPRAFVALSSPPPDLLGWPDCPPGQPYYFAPGSCFDPIDGDQECSGVPASLSTSSDAGPLGGSCSLDVTSGTLVVDDAGSSGGVAFATPGEVAGVTYTLSFDMKFVQGTDPWWFADESGNGDVNEIAFSVPYPGDRSWHRYELTATIGQPSGSFCSVDEHGNQYCFTVGGPKPTLYVYSNTDGVHEMRIDNMSLRPAAAGAQPGLHWI